MYSPKKSRVVNGTDARDGNYIVPVSQLLLILRTHIARVVCTCTYRQRIESINVGKGKKRELVWGHHHFEKKNLFIDLASGFFFFLLKVNN